MQEYADIFIINYFVWNFKANKEDIGRFQMRIFFARNLIITIRNIFVISLRYYSIVRYYSVNCIDMFFSSDSQLTEFTLMLVHTYFMTISRVRIVNTIFTIILNYRKFSISKSVAKV